MMKWKIVSDSSCDLTAKDISDDSVEFATVPLKIIVGDSEYVDDENIDVDAMLSSMEGFKGASSSACPSPGDFAQQFRSADFSIAVTMTGKLSGTFNSARCAKEMVMGESDGKKIHVIDTHATAGVMVLVIRKLKELIARGLDFEQVVCEIEKYNDSLRLLCSLSSYDNLIKSGRMPKVVGVLAATLNIRAVTVNTREGELKMVSKPRGELNAIRSMVSLMAKYKDVNGASVVISHCNNPEAAETLKKMIEETYDVNDVTVLKTRGLTSFYAADKGLILCF